MNQLIINYPDLKLLITGAKQITLNPNGEEILLKLLELKDKVDDAIKKAKDVLSVAITEIDPDLTSISSDNLKLMYRVYGTKYSINELLVNDIDEKFLIKKTTYTPNTEEIDKYIKETGILPNGVIINARSKALSIVKKNNFLIEE